MKLQGYNQPHMQIHVVVRQRVSSRRTFWFLSIPFLLYSWDCAMEAISREFRVALLWELLYADDLVAIAETEGFN